MNATDTIKLYSSRCKGHLYSSCMQPASCYCCESGNKLLELQKCYPALQHDTATIQCGQIQFYAVVVLIRCVTSADLLAPNSRHLCPSCGYQRTTPHSATHGPYNHAHTQTRKKECRNCDKQLCVGCVDPVCQTMDYRYSGYSPNSFYAMNAEAVASHYLRLARHSRRLMVCGLIEFEILPYLVLEPNETLATAAGMLRCLFSNQEVLSECGH